jgi:mycothione reductase
VSVHFDLAVIGSGSGNSILDEAFSSWRVAILEKDVFGGTCLNRGCIPTKMFVYPADLALTISHARGLGVDAHLDRVRWREIRDRIFGRIDPISASGRAYRAQRSHNVTLFEGHARFVGDRTLDTGTGETITADNVVLAAGSRVTVPDIDGLDTVGYYTSDTVMRIDEIPERLLIVGGGFVAAEFAHVFGSFGSQVTIVNRSGALLRDADHEVSARFTELAQEKWDVRLDTVVRKLEAYDGGLRAFLDEDGTDSVLEFDLLLMATGRRSNSDGLDLDRTGVAVDDQGLVVVDEHQHTTAEGIWALGDVCGNYQLKHVANHESRVVRHNLLNPEDLVESEHAHVPSAVFSAPQVASVGLTERQAQDQDVRHVVSRLAYGTTAYGWAMEDTSSFVKVLADPDTGLLLGAHLIGPQASNLIQPLIQAMSLGQTALDVARGQYWIHPALMEVVENALLGLHLDGPTPRV